MSCRMPPAFAQVPLPGDGAVFWRRREWCNAPELPVPFFLRGLRMNATSRWSWIFGHLRPKRCSWKRNEEDLFEERDDHEDGIEVF